MTIVFTLTQRESRLKVLKTFTSFSLLLSGKDILFFIDLSKEVDKEGSSLLAMTLKYYTLQIGSQEEVEADRMNMYLKLNMLNRKDVAV